MLLDDLNEAPENEVAIIFGRFNPPHKGHKAAWEMAAQSPVFYVGTNKSTHGPKDPLPFDIKIKAMEAIWPGVKGHIVADQSWLTLASKVYAKHGDVKLIILTDEEWVTKTVNQYNGVEGPHGVYKFSKIETHPTPRLSSASALRAAVVAGDKKAFSDAAGVPFNLKVAGKSFFDLVAEYLLPYQEKKKVKETKKTPWEKMEKAVPKLKGSEERSQKAIAGIKQANKDYAEIAEQDAEGNGRITGGDLKRLARYINTFFDKLGLDVKFTKHFFQRVNDPRNKHQITIAELVKLFKDEYQKWGDKISSLGKDAEAVLKDMSTDINVPVVLAWDAQRQDLDLVAKTVMRKKDFKSYTPILAVESLDHFDDLNVHFHDTLNDKLFNGVGQMYPLVRKKLMNIAEDFKNFLGIEIEGLKDITVSGSNAAFTYTPTSDIDVHLVVDLPQADTDNTFRELFDAKKYQYNAQHNYTIRGYDVELYVQNANEDHVSQGIYSLLHNDWVQEPKPVKDDYDQETTRAKYDQIKHLIMMAVKTQDYELGNRLRQTIKKYRQIGLHSTGEFGPENLAFKALRSNGYIKKLYDLLNDLKDREFSLEAHEKRLTEIDMSPGTLTKFSASDAAQNTVVGFEFEMIVRDVTGTSEEGPLEYDIENHDDFVSTGSIRSMLEDLQTFFSETTLRREVEKAVDEVNEEIFEYMDEEYDQYLSTNKDEVIAKYKENTDLSDEEIEISIAEGDDTWMEINDELRDEFNEQWDDVDGALRQLRLRKYSNWADRFSWDWPFYAEGGPGHDIDGQSMEEVANDIASYIKMPIKASSQYHSVNKREPGIWYLETDSSIDADESEGEGGLELISPPLPLPVAMAKMDQVFKWMDLNGARTDSSTGFHMNVSIPNMSKVDYTKLILFLGDEYILREFGRQSNSYTKSVLGRMQRINAPSLLKLAPDLFNTLREGMAKVGESLISSALTPRGDKYLSVNIKENYIEFRSAGGNYVENIEKIKNTLMRYVRVINLAADPTEAKEEYAKKLYKVLMSSVDKSTEADTIKWFTMYSTGNMTKFELVNRLKLVKFARMAKKNPNTPPPEDPALANKPWAAWYVYDPNGTLVHAVSARDKNEAFSLALKWSDDHNHPISRVSQNNNESKRPTSLAGYIEESDRPFVWKKDEPKESLTEMQKACILGGHEYVGELNENR